SQNLLAVSVVRTRGGLGMKNVMQRNIHKLVTALLLLVILDAPGFCSSSQLTKTNGEVVSGEFVGIVVLRAEPTQNEGSNPLYLLCPGKHVSSIDQNGTHCEENARLLLKVIAKPLGQAQMAVLEDAGYEIGHIKAKQIQMYEVPNGTKAIALKPKSD